MRERGRGSVINVASVAAFMPRGTYAASKAWVVRFTEGAALDLRGSGIRFLALCPGFVRTEFHERAGMNAERLPGWAWLDADKVVSAALRDLARGRVVSVPDARYKTAVGFARHVPSRLFGAISAGAGRSTTRNVTAAGQGVHLRWPRACGPVGACRAPLRCVACLRPGGGLRAQFPAPLGDCHLLWRCFLSRLAAGRAVPRAPENAHRQGLRATPAQ